MSRSFLLRLRKRHDVIDRMIVKKHKALGQDTVRISELKKLKLFLKDKIAHIESLSARLTATS